MIKECKKHNLGASEFGWDDWRITREWWKEFERMMVEMRENDGKIRRK